MNPEQEIELVLRVLSTRPTDEEIFHLEHEDVNPRKVEQEPEEKPEEEPEQEPEEKPEEEPEEEPVPLPVPVGGTLSSLTGRSVSFKKFRTHETTSSAPQLLGHHAHHARILPKEFFHTAGNFCEHHEEAQKVGPSHPVLQGSCFFRRWTPSSARTNPLFIPSILRRSSTTSLSLLLC